MSNCLSDSPSLTLGMLPNTEEYTDECFHFTDGVVALTYSCTIGMSEFPHDRPDNVKAI